MEREAIEASIRAAFDAGELGEAASLTVEHYGVEVLRYVHVLSRNADAAQDVFANGVERLWRTLDRFRWQCSMRVWFYRLARNAHIDHVRAAGTRAKRFTALEEAGRLSRIVAQIRSDTQPYLKTRARDWVQRIRGELEADEQTLLTLRLERGMGYREIAHILVAHELDSSGLSREAARLRKQFERIVKKIRGLAEREGVLGSG